jgi:hypothetical protein
VTYFQHTKADLANARKDARKEIGEALLALADDSSQKMETEDRTYILEDLITRLVEVAKELGADPAIFEDLANFSGGVCALPLLFEAAKPELRIVKPIVSDETIIEAHNLETYDGGYPRHKYVQGFRHGCGAQIKSTFNMSGEPVRCGRNSDHDIHEIWEKAGLRTHHDFVSYSGRSCSWLYVGTDGFGRECSFSPNHPIHRMEKK